MSRKLRSPKSYRPRGPVETKTVYGAPKLNGSTGRRHRVDAQQRKELSKSGSFALPAKFASTCVQCSTPITPGVGHMVIRCGGKWIHSACEKVAKAGRQNMLYPWEHIT